jgi:hypothetical protein
LNPITKKQKTDRNTNQETKKMADILIKKRKHSRKMNRQQKLLAILTRKIKRRKNGSNTNEEIKKPNLRSAQKSRPFTSNWRSRVGVKLEGQTPALNTKQTKKGNIVFGRMA